MQVNKTWALYLGPLAAAAVVLALAARGLNPQACWTAGVTTLCAAWWIFEPIPIPATSLIPFAVFPLVGVLGHKQVAKAIGNHMILLMMGGFMISTAMERSGASGRKEPVTLHDQDRAA